MRVWVSPTATDKENVHSYTDENNNKNKTDIPPK